MPHSQTAMVLPKPEFVTLAEAVAMVSPPLDLEKARAAIRKALEEGRLVDKPQSDVDDRAFAAMVERELVARTREQLRRAAAPAAWEVADAIFGMSDDQVVLP